MTKDTGGPAFPTEHITEEIGGDFKLPRKVTTKLQGMTLRDYFANSAMSSIVTTNLKGTDEKELAKMSYFIADAMIAERSKDE